MIYTGIEIAMIYTGIDYHKRYSVACTLDAQGRKLQEARGRFYGVMS